MANLWRRHTASEKLALLIWLNLLAIKVRCACVFYLQEVFDLRVVVSFLLDQRGAVQLTRAESARKKRLGQTFTGKKQSADLFTDFKRRQMKPDVGLHVRQLVGQDVANHLHRHPIAWHLLPHPQSPAGGVKGHVEEFVLDVRRGKHCTKVEFWGTSPEYFHVILCNTLNLVHLTTLVTSYFADSNNWVIIMD